MSKKPVILFIPTLHYLSNPIYISIADKLIGFDKLYLDTEYQMHNRYLDDYEKNIEPLRNHFDGVEYITEEEIPKRESKISELIRLRNKSHKTIATITKIDPDVIVLGSDATDIFKICNTFFTNKKLFVIQQSALRAFDDKQYSIKEKISYLFYRYILHTPILASNPWATYKDNTTHFLWSDFFCLSPYKKYIATGNPAWDRLIKVFENHKYQYSTTKNTICMATQPAFGTEDEQLYSEFILMIQQCIQELSQYNFIIKVHPREDISRYITLFPRSQYPNVTVIRDESIDSVLERSFVLITAWSMTAFESVIKGIPVIFGNPGNKKDLSTINPANIIPVANTTDALKRSIENLTQTNGYDRFLDIRNDFLKKINTTTIPNSADTIARIITNAVNN